MLTLIKKIGRDPNRKGRRYIGIFECSFCGLKVERRMDTNSNSCGCQSVLNRFSAKKLTKHGDHKKRLYKVWQGMKARCNSETSSGYEYYGARGIKVCKEWEKYKPFKKWALANGYEDSLEIDRKDTNGDYCPDNCRFVTHAENSRNRRNQKLNYKKAEEIRAKMSKGADPFVLAEKFGVTQHHILSVARGERWA